MRVAGRALLFGVFALLAVTIACRVREPFDPLSKSGKIVGLSYIDFSITWDRWDPTPNTTASSWSSPTTTSSATPSSSTTSHTTSRSSSGPRRKCPLRKTREVLHSYDRLAYSRTLEIVNSDDTVRIPIEDYRDKLAAAGLDLSANVPVFAIVRLTPPEEPGRVIVIGYPDMEVFRPSEGRRHAEPLILFGRSQGPSRTTEGLSLFHRRSGPWRFAAQSAPWPRAKASISSRPPPPAEGARCAA